MNEGSVDHSFRSERTRALETEPLDSKLKIARFFSPGGSEGPVAAMLGIPFEESQFQTASFECDGREFGLLDVMQELNLVGETDGVPHLSVGGETTQYSGGIFGYGWRTSQLTNNAARAYLFGQYSVQGTGLVHYEGREQRGFGVDGPFVRNSGAIDIGGGVDSTSVDLQKHYAERLWTQSYLHFGQPQFARIYKILQYQPWMEYRYDVAECSAVIRDDGKRNVSRKELLKQIKKILPFLTDAYMFSHAFFEIDGHNAFKNRNGDVIFTDYESMDYLSKDPVNFMFTLGDSWFFEGMRKNFPEFCAIYDFELYSDSVFPRLDIPRITEIIKDHVFGSNYIDDVLSKVKNNLRNSDEKAMVRYAMAGVIGSRSNAKEAGMQMLRDSMATVPKSLDRPLSLEEMYIQLREKIKGVDLEAESYNHERCSVQVTENGVIYLTLTINTFGLPISPVLRMPLTLADVYEHWPWRHPSEGTHEDILQPSQFDNPFAEVSDTILSETVYSKIAGVFSMITGFKQDGVTKRFKNMGVMDFSVLSDYMTFELAYKEKKDSLLEKITVNIGNSIRLYITPKEGKIKFLIFTDSFTQQPSELNAAAYTLHTSLAYLEAKKYHGYHTITVPLQ